MRRTGWMLCLTVVVGVVGFGFVAWAGEQVAVTAPQQAITVGTNENVGMGTNAPAAPLHISNDSGGGPDADLLVEDNGPTRLHLKNTSVTNSATVDQEWSLNSNGTLRITAGEDAPEFTLDAAGKLTLPQQGSQLGIGTETPAGPLHIAAEEFAYITLERTTTSSGSPGKWYISHENNDPNDFIISKDANPVAMRLTSSGHLTLDQSGSRLGIGTSTPNANLEVKTDQTFTFLRLTAAAAYKDSVDLTYTDGGGTPAFRINIDDGDAQEFAVDLNGNVTIAGTLTTGGPSCSGGCDAVFQPEIQVESIEEHAQFMWEKSHLQGVGPTVENAPINLSSKVGGILNELEKAHIYIERLHERLKAKEAEAAEWRDEVGELRGTMHAMERLMAERLAGLEARLAAQESRPAEASALVAAR